MDDVGMSDTMLQVWPYLRDKVPVFIRRTDETGELVYSICVADDPEFWLHAFRNKSSAVRFCKQHGLEVLDE